MLCASCATSELDETAKTRSTSILARDLANEVVALNAQHFVRETMGVELSDGEEKVFCLHPTKEPLGVSNGQSKEDIWVSTTRGAVHGPGELTFQSTSQLTVHP